MSDLDRIVARTASRRDPTAEQAAGNLIAENQRYRAFIERHMAFLLANSRCTANDIRKVFGLKPIDNDYPGFNTVVTLECGCTFGLNVRKPADVPQNSWYYACINGHSKIADYDQVSGRPNFQRDQLVKDVVMK